MRLSLLARFLLLSTAGLLCLMPLWYYFSPALSAPVFYLAGEASYLVFPWALGYERNGTSGILHTTLKVYSQVGGQFKAGKLAPLVDYRMLGYGIVMFWAMMLASRPPAWGRKLLLGSLAIVPIQALCVCLQWFNDVFNRSGPDVFAQTGLPRWVADMVAFGYHFNLFIFTALAPVMVWLLMNRAFLARLWSELLPQPSTAVVTAPTESERR